MHLRVMTKADICAAQRVKEIAGWNQTKTDWERFLEASETGCFVAELDGQVCGTATTISFENRFAWVGMVLVDPAFRGRGIGTRLLERTIEYLDALRIPSIKLDATPQGKPLYEKLGFLPEYEIERWSLRRPPVQVTELSGAGRFADPLPSLLEQIFEMDREIFGANRSFLLRSVHQEAPDFTAAITVEGRLRGYTFGWEDLRGSSWPVDGQRCCYRPRTAATIPCAFDSRRIDRRLFKVKQRCRTAVALFRI